MGLVIERRGTTTESISTRPLQCHTCKERKTGVFDVDANGRPRCPECAAASKGGR